MQELGATVEHPFKLVRGIAQTVFGFLAGAVFGFAMLFLSFVTMNASPSSRAAELVVIGSATVGALFVTLRLIRAYATLLPATYRHANRGPSRLVVLAQAVRTWLAWRPAISLPNVRLPEFRRPAFGGGEGTRRIRRHSGHCTEGHAPPGSAFEVLGLTPSSTTPTAPQPSLENGQLADVA